MPSIVVVISSPALKRGIEASPGVGEGASVGLGDGVGDAVGAGEGVGLGVGVGVGRGGKVQAATSSAMTAGNARRMLPTATG